MTLEFPRHIFVKRLEYQISPNSVLSKPSCSMWTDRQTDRQTDMKITVAFFAKAPKRVSELLQVNRGKQ
jgi:hypothetical protein